MAHLSPTAWVPNFFRRSKQVSSRDTKIKRHVKTGGTPTRSTHNGSLTSRSVHSKRSSVFVVGKQGLNRRETGSPEMRGFASA